MQYSRIMHCIGAHASINNENNQRSINPTPTKGYTSILQLIPRSLWHVLIRTYRWWNDKYLPFPRRWSSCNERKWESPQMQISRQDSWQKEGSRTIKMATLKWDKFYAQYPLFGAITRGENSPCFTCKNLVNPWKGIRLLTCLTERSIKGNFGCRYLHSPVQNHSLWTLEVWSGAGQ